MIRWALKIIAECDGVLSVHQGIDTDGKTGFITVESTSYKAYKNVAGTEKYNNVMEGLKTAMAGPWQTIHIESKTSPSAAFDAPITGVCELNLKDGYTPEQIAKVAERMDELVMAAEGSRKPTAYGEAVQKPGTWGAIAGWDSAEAYKNFREQEARVKIMGEILTMCEMTIHQVKFNKFSA